MLYEDILRGCEKYHRQYAKYDKAYDEYFNERDPSMLDNTEEIKKLVKFLDDFECFPRYTKEQRESAEGNKRKVIQNLPRALMNIVLLLEPLEGKTLLDDVEYDQALSLTQR